MNPIGQQNKFWLGVGLFSFSFLLLALSAVFPALWFLVFFGLTPLFFASHVFKPKSAVWGGLAVGLGYFGFVFYPLSTLNTWWWTVSSGFFWDYRGLIFFSFTVLLAILSDLFTFGPIFFLYSKWLKKTAGASILILPAAWSILELVRVKIFSGLEWGIFGQPLGENLFLARAATFGGIFSLSFLAVMVNFCVFLILKNFRIGRAGKIAVPAAVILVVLVGLAANNQSLATGKFGGQDKETVKETETKTLAVALISPNIKTQEAGSRDGIERLFGLIGAAAAKEPDLIITPENVFPTLVIDEKTELPVNYGTDRQAKENFDRLLAISADQPETSFIVGLHTARDGRRFNSALTFENGKIVSIYNKQNLLPFTEKSFSFFESIHIDPLEAGQGRPTLATKNGKFAPLICSEILITPGRRAERANGQTGGVMDGVAFINLSNDNVFDSKRVANYNKIIARLRAIQTGRPVIRSAKGGFSGIFDETGAEIPVLAEQNDEVRFAKLQIANDIP